MKLLTKSINTTVCLESRNAILLRQFKHWRWMCRAHCKGVHSAAHYLRQKRAFILQLNQKQIKPAPRNRFEDFKEIESVWTLGDSW